MKNANDKSFDGGLPNGRRWSDPILLMAVAVSESRQCRMLVTGPSYGARTSAMCAKVLKSWKKNYISQGCGGLVQTHL